MSRARRSRHLAAPLIAAVLALSSVTPAVALGDTDAPVVGIPVVSAAQAAAGVPVWVSVDITDNTDIVSAELTVDGGATWQPMALVGGSPAGSSAIAKGAVNAKVAQLVPGGYSSCVIFANRSAACWGDNTHGALGDGTTKDRLYPGPVEGLTAISSMDQAEYVGCASLADKSLWCWGDNDSGQLADASKIDQPAPVHIAPDLLTSVVAPETEGWTECALHDDGGLSCWGANWAGQLGDGTLTDNPVPARVPGVTNVAEVAMGYGHVCVRLAGGTVDCWGDASSGQMPMPAVGDHVATPTAVVGLSSVTAIEAGDYHTCAILAGGALSCWGSNGYGQLGDGTTTDRPTPAVVEGIGTVVDLELGSNHTCILNDAGEVWCWGANYNNQMGDGTTTDRLAPAKVTSLGDVTVRDIGTRGDAVCALLGDSSVTCWGYGPAVGAGSYNNSASPTPVIGLTGPIAAPGSYSVCVRATDSAGNTSPDMDACVGLDITAAVHSLTTNTTGGLLGYVASYDDSGLIASCDGPCSQDVAEGASVTVYANAYTGNTFTGWTTGPCADTTTNPCVFTMDRDAALTASFAQSPVIATPTVKARVGGTLASASTTSTIPVTVSWASTHVVPLASALVERSTNGGITWTTVATPAATAASVNTVAPSTGTVRFRVTLTDTVGASGTAATAAITPGLVQQTSTAVKWAGTWSTYRLASLSGGSGRYATAKGAYATYTGTFRSVAVVAPKGPGRGYIQVLVDGVSKAKISLLRSTLQARVVIWQIAVPYGRHTVKLVNLATSGKPRVDVDAIVTFR